MKDGADAVVSLARRSETVARHAVQIAERELGMSGSEVLLNEGDSFSFPSYAVRPTQFNVQNMRKSSLKVQVATRSGVMTVHVSGGQEKTVSLGSLLGLPYTVTVLSGRAKCSSS